MFEDVTVEELSLFDDTFKNAENKEIPEIPDGVYTGQVSSVILTKTKRDNTPMIIINFIDDATDWPIDVIHVLSIKSIFFLKKNLMALGFPEQGNFSQNLKDFVEKFSMPKHVLLKRESYTAKNGKVYSNNTLLSIPPANVTNTKAGGEVIIKNNIVEEQTDNFLSPPPKSEPKPRKKNKPDKLEEADDIPF